MKFLKNSFLSFFFLSLFLCLCVLLTLISLKSLKSSECVSVSCASVPFTLFSDPKTSYRENLGLFMQEKACLENRKVKVIEIGVWRGDFAQEILDRFHSVIDEYVMIEPALKLTGQLAPELEKRLKEFPKNFPSVKFRHVNEISVDAANIFPDFYFDWIYIDALHTFQGVSDDIRLYWPKLRNKGLFSGHDFSCGTSRCSSDSRLYFAPWSGKRMGKEKAGFPGSYKAAMLHSKEFQIPIHYSLEGRYGKGMYDLMDTSVHFKNNPSWFMFKIDVRANNSINTSYSFEDGVFTRRFEE